MMIIDDLYKIKEPEKKNQRLKKIKILIQKEMKKNQKEKNIKVMKEYANTQNILMIIL